jgi:hypothetical protein
VEKYSGRPQTWWLDQVRRDIETEYVHGGRWKKCRSGEIETAGDSFAEVNPQEWKRHKEGEDE